MKKPSVCGFYIYKNNDAHVAVQANENFKKMSKNERLIFLNRMGRLLMQMIISTQKEDANG